MEFWAWIACWTSWFKSGCKTSKSGSCQRFLGVLDRCTRLFNFVSFIVVQFTNISLNFRFPSVQGIFDLFWLPIEQYQKDGRIVRGLQRGAQSFTARTALAALEITSRLIYLLQVGFKEFFDDWSANWIHQQITAETAYDMVSPGPSVRRRVNRKGKRKRIHPPQVISSLLLRTNFT